MNILTIIFTRWHNRCKCLKAGMPSANVARKAVEFPNWYTIFKAKWLDARAIDWRQTGG